MVSVFCSKNLIFAPESWKCILKAPISKFFQGVSPHTHLESSGVVAYKSHLH